MKLVGGNVIGLDGLVPEECAHVADEGLCGLGRQFIRFSGHVSDSASRRPAFLSDVQKTDWSSIAPRGPRPTHCTEAAMYSCNRCWSQRGRRFAGKPGNSDRKPELAPLPAPLPKPFRSTDPLKPECACTGVIGFPAGYCESKGAANRGGLKARPVFCNSF